MSSPVYHKLQLPRLEAGPTLTSVSEYIQGSFGLIPEIGCEVTADSAKAIPFPNKVFLACYYQLRGNFVTFPAMTNRIQLT